MQEKLENTYMYFLPAFFFNLTCFNQRKSWLIKILYRKLWKKADSEIFQYLIKTPYNNYIIFSFLTFLAHLLLVYLLEQTESFFIENRPISYYILIWSVILPHCAFVFSETHLPSFNADNLIGALIPLLQTTSTGRYRSRFFDQVWHQSAYASMGNKYFITE